MVEGQLKRGKTFVLIGGEESVGLRDVSNVSPSGMINQIVHGASVMNPISSLP